jgi:hypothetical protein
MTAITLTTPRKLAGALVASVASAILVLALGAPASRGSESAGGILTYIVNARSAAKQEVETAHTDGNAARLLGAGTTATPSPNGASVAVVRLLPPLDNASSELLIYPRAGGSPTKLYHCKGFLTLYGWSADSARILSTCPHGLSQTGPLLVIDAASGSVTALASGVVDGASFAPNSSDHVVYALGASQLLSAPVNLFTTSPRASGTVQLTHGGINTNPLWGPRAIIFARQTSRGHTKAPINQLWAIQPDGSGARQLTHMSVNPLASGLVPIALSASGQHLLADFEGTDQSSAWAVDLAAATVVPRRLVNSENVANAISKNGSTVLLTNGFEGNPTSIETVPFAGGRPTVLVRHGDAASWNA